MAMRSRVVPVAVVVTRSTNNAQGMFEKIKTNALWCQILVPDVTADAQCFDARPFCVPTYLAMLFPAANRREGVKVARC
jgi:hypothetical protein